ncbi:MAG: zinc-ribbon domain-containing protein [Deltaproteobacteria bacterium]|nr:zinc-ribbon domain-containing protein [Deltaproteobacteria bacterium]
MKFVCEKCRTKYSIADDKVRRKVLKIRCKNCANIIVVQDPSRVDESSPSVRPDATGPSRPPAGGGGALDRAFEGAFSGRAAAPRAAKPAVAALKVSPPAPVLVEQLEEEFEPEKTNLSPPGFREAAVADEDWYLAVDGSQFGPMNFAELCSRVKRGEARGATGDEAHVWRDGFDDWVEISRLPELRPYVPPPPPRTRSGLFRLGSSMSSVGAIPPPAVPAAAGSRTDGSGALGVPARTPMPPRAGPLAPAAPALASAPPSMGSVGTAAASRAAEASFLELPPAMESGLRALPQSFAEGPMVVPPPALMPAAAPSRTPASIKIAAVGGIISALTGVAILVYFLVFDRPPKQPVGKPLGAGTVAAVRSTTPAGGGAGEGDSGDVAIDFPPVEVERSSGERSVRGKAAPTPARRPAKGATPGGPKMTDEQKRLAALYGTGGDDPGVPSAGSAGGVARGHVPARRITPTEVANVQKNNRSSLKACYERALKRDNTLAEVKADVEVSIGDTGTVRSVKITGVNSPELDTCLSRSIRRWAFPSVGRQEFVFSINFRGS